MPISYRDFFLKYNGKPVEVGGSTDALNQCVDLVNAYLVEVLGQSKVLGTNARDFPSKLTQYVWTPNDPDNEPDIGDIIVWQHNQYGHIAICDSSERTSFISFDQNWPTDSVAHLQIHNYINPPVAGWLKVKGASMPTMTVEVQVWEKIRNNSESYDLVCDMLGIERNSSKDVVRPRIEEYLKKVTKYDNIASIGFGDIGDIKTLQLQKQRAEYDLKAFKEAGNVTSEDMSKWTENGMMIETGPDGTFITKNYTPNQSK